MIYRKIHLKGIEHIGTITFKESQQFRKKYYPVNKFTSKNSIKGARWLIKKYGGIKSHICDPMVGIGTYLVEAISLGHTAYGFDIYEYQIQSARENAEWRQRHQKNVGCYKLHWMPGNLAYEVLPPGSMDLTIWSPPYGLQNHSMGTTKKQIDLQKKKNLYSCQSYGKESPFRENDVSKCKNIKAFYESMKPLIASSVRILKRNGYMIIVLQDYIRKGKPVGIVQGFVDLVLEHSPMKAVGYHTRQVPITYFKQGQIKKGNNVVVVEHMLVFRKKK